MTIADQSEIFRKIKLADLLIPGRSARCVVVLAELSIYFIPNSWNTFNVKNSNNTRSIDK